MNKNDDRQGLGNGCPKREFLSSCFDNELDVTSPEFIHISSCPECRKKIDDFAKIGEIINRNILNGCSPPLPEDILKKVRAKISEEKNTGIPFYLIQFMKIAAVIVVVVGVFAYINSMGGKKVQIPGIVGIKTAPASSSISPAPSETKGIASRKNFMPENEIQFSNMSNVSTGQDMEFRNLPSDGDATKAEPVSIPDYVTHVWTVKNLKDASAEVNDCVAKLGIPTGGINVSKENDNIVRYSMNLSKKQISGFVKLFASAGNELLSPAAPQPEQNLFYGNATDPVNYEIKLIQKGK
ncbi:MAG: hypothetical protein NT118_05685 [Lentisphaerae bacterium]|nr:hypothetical protein [Lentisphaerota bacterium]